MEKNYESTKNESGQIKVNQYISNEKSEIDQSKTGYYKNQKYV